MSYRVRTESFEGPFDLLLKLVSRQRVDIGAISVSAIADQYLDEIQRMGKLDADVASDFLVVAATLLEIKAAALVDEEAEEPDEDVAGDMAPETLREVLLERLLRYRQYKSATAALAAQGEAAARMHPRTFGPPEEFADATPDYLEGVRLEDLANGFVTCVTRQDVSLLDNAHIAGKTLTVERSVSRLRTRLRSEGHLRFSDMAPAGSRPEVIVVTFLAVLELLKRNMVRVNQETPFGDIALEYVEGSDDGAPLDALDDYGEEDA